MRSIGSDDTHPASCLLGNRLKRLVWPLVPDLLLNLNLPPPYNLIRKESQDGILHPRATTHWHIWR